MNPASKYVTWVCPLLPFLNCRIPSFKGRCAPVSYAKHLIPFAIKAFGLPSANSLNPDQMQSGYGGTIDSYS